MFKFCVLTILIAFFCIGCSGNFSPIAPSSDLNNETSSQPIGVLVEGYNADGLPSGFGILGLFNASIDLKDLTAELAPLRTGAIDDTV
jgi:hypothetical protein